MRHPRIDRRRFLGGSVVLGAATVLGPAGVAALRGAGARSVAPPGARDVMHDGARAASHTHAPRPVLVAPTYVTVVQTRHTPAGVRYLAAVARPA